MGLNKIAFGALTAASAVCLAIMPNLAHSQNSSIASVFEVLLMQTLEPCYQSPSQPLENDDEIALSVQLDAYGDMAKLPVLNNTDELTMGEIALQKAAVSALVDCTPMQSQDRGKGIVGTFDMIVNSGGISLAEVDVNVIRVGLEDQDTLVLSTTTGTEQSGDDAQTNAADNQVDAATETSENEDETLLQGIILEGGTEETEAALELTRAERIEIQRRLTILEYDTKGIDGVFGPATRSAIGIWQIGSGNDISGYLNAAQLYKLRQMTEDEYTPEPSETAPQYYVDGNGCLRHPNGVIITGRTIVCDLNAAAQSLGFTK